MLTALCDHLVEKPDEDLDSMALFLLDEFGKLRVIVRGQRLTQVRVDVESWVGQRCHTECGWVSDCLSRRTKSD